MHLRFCVFCLLIVSVVAPQAAAGTLYASYEANPLATVPGGVYSPVWLGWLGQHNADAFAAGVVNDAALGVNAWRITDSLATGANPSYVAALDPIAASAALTTGFRFTATMRYIDDFGTGANMGLSMYLNQRAYHLMLDLNATRDLQATLHGRAGATALTTGGTGSAGYHTITLQSTGGTSVTALFDGQPIGAPWTGIVFGQQHADIVLFGNSDQAISQRGSAAFSEVAFEYGPPTVALPGDFDGNARVDGSDFTLWQRTLGSRTNLAADASANGVVDAADLAIWKQRFGTSTPPAVPAAYAIAEPATAALGAVALAALGMRRRVR